MQPIRTMPNDSLQPVLIMITAAAVSDRIAVAEELKASFDLLGFETVALMPQMDEPVLEPISHFELHKHLAEQRLSMDPKRPAASRKFVSPIPVTDCEYGRAHIAVIGSINSGKTMLMRYIASQLALREGGPISVVNHSEITKEGMNGCCMQDFVLSLTKQIRIMIAVRDPINSVPMVDLMRACVPGINVPTPTAR